MAKILDLQRLRVIYALYSLCDKNGHFFIHPIALTSFKLDFGVVNKKTGEGRVKVFASFFDSVRGRLSYTFYAVYNYKFESCRIFSVTVERDFKSSVLFSVNNDKINGLWLLEEEEEEGGVPVGVCPVVADDDSAYSKNDAVIL